MLLGPLFHAVQLSGTLVLTSISTWPHLSLLLLTLSWRTRLKTYMSLGTKAFIWDISGWPTVFSFFMYMQETLPKNFSSFLLYSNFQGGTILV
jgi:hypothetical protein